MLWSLKHVHVIYKVFKQIYVLAKRRPHKSEKSRYNWFFNPVKERKVVCGHIYLFESLKTMSLCSHQKQYTISVSTNRASVSIIRVSISSKRRLTLKKTICLHQTEPLFEPNRAFVYDWNHYSYSLCGVVSTLK